MQPTTPQWMGEEFPNTYWEVIQGDTLAFYIEMFCDCPDPVDITGYQFLFKVKESMDPDDPNTLCEVLWTALQSQCGITALIVIPKLTALLPDGRYAMDLKYRTPSGLVETLERGVLGVLPSTNLEFSFNQEVPPATSQAASREQLIQAGILASPGSNYLQGY